MQKITLFALDPDRELRFFVITFPAFEKSRSLATEVAGTASKRRATAATNGYCFLFLLAYLSVQK